MKPLSGSALPLLRAFSGVERVNERRDVEQGHKFRRRRPHPLMLLPPSLDFKVWDPRKRETGKSFPFGDMIGVSFYSFWRQFTHCGRLQRVVYLFRTRESEFSSQPGFKAHPSGAATDLPGVIYTRASSGQRHGIHRGITALSSI